jgi:hypothetical protein
MRASSLGKLAASIPIPKIGIYAAATETQAASSCLPSRSALSSQTAAITAQSASNARVAYRAMAGYFAYGTLAELFLDVPGKGGTAVQQNANTAAILTSLLLQHGIPPELIRHSVTGPIAIALAKFSEGA